MPVVTVTTLVISPGDLRVFVVLGAPLCVGRGFVTYLFNDFKLTLRWPIIAQVSSESEVLMTSLGEACATGDIQSMTHLLDNGASVNDFIVSGYAIALRLVKGWRDGACCCDSEAVFLSFSTTDCLVSFGSACTVACNLKLAQMGCAQVWLHLQSVQVAVLSFVYSPSRVVMMMMDQLPCLSLPCMVNSRPYACC